MVPPVDSKNTNTRKRQRGEVSVNMDFRNTYSRNYSLHEIFGALLAPTLLLIANRPRLHVFFVTRCRGSLSLSQICVFSVMLAFPSLIRTLGFLRFQCHPLITVARASICSEK